jgi:hypothetical protein
MVEQKEDSVFAGKGQTELKTIARLAIGEAKKAKDPLEVLGCLQVSSEALKAGELTVESIGMGMSNIIKVANRAYHGSAPEASAIHGIAARILSSFPQAKRISK